MRHLVPLAFLLIAAPASAFGLEVQADAQEATVTPDARAAHVDALVAHRRVGPVDAPTREAPAARAAVVDGAAHGRDAPLRAHGASASAGRDGTMRTTDPESLHVEVEVRAEDAPVLRSAGAGPLALRVGADGARVLHVERDGDALRNLAPRAQAELRSAAAHISSLIARVPMLHPAAPLPPSVLPMNEAAPERDASARADVEPQARAPIAAEGEHGAPLALLVATAAAAGAILLLLPIALYHRLRGQGVLGHATRARLAALLRERPGLHASAIATALALDPKTVLYHLRRLQKERLVVVEGTERARRYFLAGTMPADARAAVLARQVSPDVLDAIRQSPGLTKSDLAERLAIARSTLAWHLARLARAGLVRIERDGRAVRVHPSEA